jgi:MFS superfamily sulfate permease-like transporter
MQLRNYRFPTPRAPPMNLFFTLIGDSVAIAILTFALQISFAKLFAKKHNYAVSANQEFFAYGASNAVASFFNGYPGCVALSRCIIADGIGVKTQIVGGISALIMLVIIMALGPYLATLPNVSLIYF